MKKYLPYIVLFTLSILFYWISSRSYSLQSGELENMELFRLFRGISNLIGLFVPLMLFVFYMLTSGLMFTLLNEKVNPEKMGFAITISFIPIILNCLIYLLVLYGIEDGGTLSEMLHQPSFMGLGLLDMEELSYIFWLGFYLFFAILLGHEFELGVSKALAISCTPTLLVVLLRWAVGLY
ncbi:hypothetical protein SAMN04488057_11293 [Cyclobacterium lianum]|uniref:Yip1 domain-containing protein n=1 Tax=Cyclobacterium lianum TaxID=388280 RepID=A0A1M7PZT1_9BACT|nr:hypothetical protein [Cyclobacterium lianum]SHN23306.1 hypothetical protein SAMN04488057_11293 [Cyclobacterium lianum]